MPSDDCNQKGCAQAGVYHVHPLYGKKHDLDGECWCDPKREVPCSECNEGNEGHFVAEEGVSRWVPNSAADCWKCQGSGWVEWDPEDDFQVMIVTHTAREE